LDPPVPVAEERSSAAAGEEILLLDCQLDRRSRPAPPPVSPMAEAVAPPRNTRRSMTLPPPVCSRAEPFGVSARGTCARDGVLEWWSDGVAEWRTDPDRHPSTTPPLPHPSTT